MHRALRAAERTFRDLPADAPGRDLAWRELTLAQSSRLAFLMVRDQAGRYAEQRFDGHLARFAAACRAEDLAALAEIAELDDPWTTAAPAVTSAASGASR